MINNNAYNNAWLLIEDYVRELRIQNKTWVEIFVDITEHVQTIFKSIELEEY